MQSRFVLQSSLITSLLALGLSGCSTPADAGAPATGSASPGAASPAAAAKPTGPAFKSKAMGMDMVQPLVQKTLVAPLEALEITAPDNARIEESRGSVKLVSAGVNYSISIRQTSFEKAKSLEIFKTLDPKGTVADESDTHLIFKRENGSHLLAAVMTVDGKPYTCGSVATARSFTREEIDQTLTSCRTLKKKA